MKENITRGNLWNQAAGAGVALGAVSAAYMAVTQALAGVSTPWLVNIVTFVLWTAKFIGCIMLMRFFMKRLVSIYSGVDNRTTFRFGMIVSLCSAVLYAAVTLANVTIISPDLIPEQMALAKQMYSGILDSNSMAMLDRIEGMMPQITFFSNLIYCFIYGVVLSAILSRNIPSTNPFAEPEEDNTTNA